MNVPFHPMSIYLEKDVQKKRDYCIKNTNDDPGETDKLNIMDLEYLTSLTKAHFDPSDIKSIDGVVTLNSIMKKRNREKQIKSLKDLMIPTFCVIIFLIGLFIITLSTGTI